MPNIHAMTCKLPPGDETGECAVCASLLEEIRLSARRTVTAMDMDTTLQQRTFGEIS